MLFFRTYFVTFRAGSSCLGEIRGRHGILCMAFQLLFCLVYVLFAPGMQAVGTAMPDGLLKNVVVPWAKRKQRRVACTNNIFLAFLAVNFSQIL